MRNRLSLALFLALLWAFLLSILATPAFGGSQEYSNRLASEIIDDTEALLSETSGDMWAPADLLQYLNDGMMDIVSRTHCMQAVENISGVTSQTAYTMTNDFIKIVAACYAVSGATKGLTKGNMWSVGNVEDSGQPVYWYEWGGSIYVYPTPDDALGTIVVYYVENPGIILSGTTVPTPHVYDKALTLYIVAQAYLEDGKPQMFNYIMKLYYEELDRYRTDFTQPPKETDVIIKQ